MAGPERVSGRLSILYFHGNGPQVPTQIARQEYDGPSDEVRPTPDRETDDSSSDGPLQISSARVRETDWLRARNRVALFPLSLLLCCCGIETILDLVGIIIFL